MELHKLKKIKGNKFKSKRRARGIGSGKGGHTMGKGMKGQKSRAGHSLPYGFEGGQVPFYKKIPQFGGFRNPNAKKIVSITLNKLNVFDDASTVTPESLVENNIIKYVPRDGVKVIASGKIEKKLTLAGFLLSEGARKKLEKAGSTIKND